MNLTTWVEEDKTTNSDTTAQVVTSANDTKPVIKQAPNATSSSVPNTNSAANNNRGNNRDQRGGSKRFERRPSEYEEKLVEIARVTNVVKGGRRFSFSALVVIGNKKGKVGYGHGKANEVPDAIKKAIKDAQRNLINVPIVEARTIPHVVEAKFVASKVLLKPAQKGRGLIASGSVRAVVELAGYKDIVTKSLGSSSKTNTVKATLEALKKLTTAKDLAQLRDIDITTFANYKAPKQSATQAQPPLNSSTTNTSN